MSDFEIKNKVCQRKEAKELRESLTNEYRKECSISIEKQLRGTSMYHEAHAVFSYASFGSEVDTWEINRKILKDGKILYLPKTNAKEKKMEFYPVSDLSGLKAGYMGIYEPLEIDNHEIKEGRILMIMPGLAFDRKKNRLGYGGGFYDRYLAQYPEFTTIMLAYAKQEMPQIITEDTDRKVMQIITENEIIT